MKYYNTSLGNCAAPSSGVYQVSNTLIRKPPLVRSLHRNRNRASSFSFNPFPCLNDRIAPFVVRLRASLRISKTFAWRCHRFSSFETERTLETSRLINKFVLRTFAVLNGEFSRGWRTAVFYTLFSLRCLPRRSSELAKGGSQPY